MIRKMIIIMLLILCIQDITFSANLSNSKQIDQEKRVDTYYSEYAQNNKSIPYKLLILEDYMVTYLIGGNNKSIGNDIKSLMNKYEEIPSSNNYKYLLKAYELYDALCMKIVAERTNQQKYVAGLSNKIIIIPNDVYNELDNEILQLIFTLNVTARHL